MVSILDEYPWGVSPAGPWFRDIFSTNNKVAVSTHNNFLLVPRLDPVDYVCLLPGIRILAFSLDRALVGLAWNRLPCRCPSDDYSVYFRPRAPEQAGAGQPENAPS